MAREFNIPSYYLSDQISLIKHIRKEADHRKKDFSPTEIDLGAVSFKIARFFGFCFGVQNAIEIAYRAISENPGKRIFLLSEMIHNFYVNEDLQKKGVRFLRTTEGEQLIDFAELTSDDIVIIPAFGTTPELLDKLKSRGIDPCLYNTTCPFVEKVWKRAHQLGQSGYTVVVHGKYNHEETRATFSHAKRDAPTIIIRDIEEAQILSDFILERRSPQTFSDLFDGRYSPDFSVSRDLRRIGVVNQTTMLATETQAIADLLRKAMLEKYGEDNIAYHFADTRDTLCYATSENQRSVFGLIESGGDLAIIVGGYNSSNTSHLAELFSGKMPAYHIKDSSEIISRDTIRHLVQGKGVIETEGWLPKGKERISILLTAGASCPDVLVEDVIYRIAELFGVSFKVEDAIA